MTYKEAVSVFKSRIGRVEGKVPKLTNDEILLEMSIIQANLQNTYYLMVKNSRNNSTAQTNLIAGQDTYAIGTTATTIPNDILEVRNIFLNDNTKRALVKKDISYIKANKVSAIPSAYSIVGQNTTLALELDCLPSSAFELTIMYYPKYEIYHGSGGVNTCDIWTDVDYSATGWGGSFKLPSQWDNVIVNGALAEVTRDKYTYEIFESNVKDLLTNRPIHWDRDIPYDDGTAFHRTLEIGQDMPRNI